MFLLNGRLFSCNQLLSNVYCILIIFYLPLIVFQKSKFHKPQTLSFRNGYTVTPPPKVGIGGEPVKNTLLEDPVDLSQLSIAKPEMIYGQDKQAPEEDYIPAHVAFDKKV